MQVAEKVNDSIGANIKELLAGSLYKACCVAAMFEIFFIEGLFFEWQYLYVACFMVLSPFGLLYFWGLQEKWGSCNLGEKFIAIMIVFIGITSFKTMVSVNSQIGKSYRSFIMQKETEDMPKEKLVTIDKFKDKLNIDMVESRLNF